jgi:hypothetical protein
MRNFKAFALVACCFCFASFSAFSQENRGIKQSFDENWNVLKRPADVLKYFEISWIKIDSAKKDAPSYTSYYGGSNEKQKIYVQFFGRHGCRVGTRNNSIEYYRCSDYFYVYLVDGKKESLFYIDELQGSGGYVIPDTNGSIYLDHWEVLGFSFSKPSNMFSYMPKEQVRDFDIIIKKFLACCKAAHEKIILSRMKVEIVSE